MRNDQEVVKLLSQLRDDFTREIRALRSELQTFTLSVTPASRTNSIEVSRIHVYFLVKNLHESFRSRWIDSFIDFCKLCFCFRRLLDWLNKLSLISLLSKSRQNACFSERSSLHRVRSDQSQRNNQSVDWMLSLEQFYSNRWAKHAIFDNLYKILTVWRQSTNLASLVLHVLSQSIHDRSTSLDSRNVSSYIVLRSFSQECEIYELNPCRIFVIRRYRVDYSNTSAQACEWRSTRIESFRIWYTSSTCINSTIFYHRKHTTIALILL